MKTFPSSQYIEKYAKNPLIIGTFLLTLSGLATKILGFFYRIFLSHIFHEEELGIIGLTSPVMFLVHSLCVSGLQNAITRYVASTYHEQRNHAYRYLFSGLFLSVSSASCMSVLVYQHAPFIAYLFIHEERCAPLLQIIALSFPLAAMHACINGFFYGCRKTLMPALSQLYEQCIRVFCVFGIYQYFLAHNTQPSLAIASIGLLSGECFSAIFSSIWLFVHARSEKNLPFPSKLPISIRHGQQLCILAWPISLNRLAVSLLSTLETTQLPRQLALYGYSNSQALSIYGIFSGMAFPLIMFPSALTSSVATLLLPTISEVQATKNHKRLKKLIGLSILLSFTFGIFCMVFFFLASDFLGAFLFQHDTVGKQIRALSLLCPFFYSTSILNSILHGLGKTSISFVINLFSLGLRLGIVFLFIPHLGFYGYLYGLVLCQFIQNLLIILALRSYIIYN